MKRTDVAVIVVALTILATVTATYATDSTVLGGYARKDGMTGQLRDSEHPNHTVIIGSQTVTLSGHSTTTLTGVQVNIEEREPLDLVFRETSNVPPVLANDLQPPGLLWINDAFTDTDTSTSTATSIGRFMHVSETTRSPFSFANGHAIIAQPGGYNGSDLIYEGGSLMMPQAAVSTTIYSHTGTDTGWDRAGPALIKDASNFIAAYYDRAGTPYIALCIKNAGTNHCDLGLTTVTLATPFDLMLTVVSNSATVWYKTTGLWTKGFTYDLATSSYIDFRTATLTPWYAGLAVFSNSASASTWNFSSLKAGRFGHLGFRDPQVYTNEANEAIMTGSVVTLTATATDAAAAAYMGVFTYDLLAKTLTQTGVIMVSRDGKIFNDNDGQIMQASDTGQYFHISTWGNAGTGASNIQIIEKKETASDLTVGSNLVSGMSTLALPGIPSGGGAYGGNLIKLDGTWYLAYTIGPSTPSTFYTALSSSSDLSSWTLVGSDSSRYPYEGTRIVEANGSHWIGTGSIADTIFYDLSMNYVGKQAILPIATGNPPHPMFIPYGKYVYCLTFDGTTNGYATYTIGNLRTFRSLRYTTSP